MTNQAIQVLQGPYITNTYGGGIQCQGPTRNFTPYVTGTASGPNLGNHIMTTLYMISVITMVPSMDDGNAIGDGIIDNPGAFFSTKKLELDRKITTV